MLVLVDLTGPPCFTPGGPFGTFATNGTWLLSGPVPPGLTGHVATFQSFGLISPTKVGESNWESLTVL